MNEKILRYFLQIIKKNGDIGALLNEGLSLTNISDLITITLKTGLISYEEKDVIITKNGEIELDRLNEKYRKQDKEEWISKERKSMIEKFDLDFVFLPDPNELFF
jgi:hypothetical protein